MSNFSTSTYYLSLFPGQQFLSLGLSSNIYILFQHHFNPQHCFYLTIRALLLIKHARLELNLIIIILIRGTAAESHLSSLAPTSGLFPANPGILMWSLMTMMSPTVKSGLSPPAALVRMTVSTPISLNTRIGMVVCPNQISTTSSSDHTESRLKTSTN